MNKFWDKALASTDVEFDPFYMSWLRIQEWHATKITINNISLVSFSFKKIFILVISICCYFLQFIQENPSIRIVRPFLCSYCAPLVIPDEDDEDGRWVESKVRLHARTVPVQCPRDHHGVTRILNSSFYYTVYTVQKVTTLVESWKNIYDNNNPSASPQIIIHNLQDPGGSPSWISIKKSSELFFFLITKVWPFLVMPGRSLWPQGRL